jgi:SAM-dependent methyltransferase
MTSSTRTSYGAPVPAREFARAPGAPSIACGPVSEYATTPMPVADRSAWFREHYEQAAGEIVQFFAGDCISLTGKRVGDIGCGDGIIDLGVCHLSDPAHLVGFDLAPTDVTLLAEVAREEKVDRGIPENLEFRTCTVDRLPCEDAYFDYLFSWSAFEHIKEPEVVAREMRRVLRPDGVLMVQVWPFYHSKHGSHLHQWFPEGFAQLLLRPEELAAKVRQSPGDDPAWSEYLLDLVPDLNRITVDDLQRALLVAGFFVAKVELLTDCFHIPRPLAHLPLSLLGITGVKLLAGIA